MATHALGGGSSAHARLRLRLAALVLLLPWVLAAVAAASECSRWPSDQKHSYWDKCSSCLRERRLQLAAVRVAHAEVVWNRTLRTLDDQVPSDTCKLWADNCTIGVISRTAFARAPCLIKVSLEANAISELHPQTFSGNSELLELGLQRNGLVFQLERPFINSTSLRILDLSFCNISVVYNTTFSALPNVSVLMLRANKIEAFSFEMFASLRRLEVLDVAENLISRIDSTSRISLRCFSAERNPMKEILQILMKFESNVSLVFSRRVCCCNATFCDNNSDVIRSVSEWISKCDQCHYNFVTASLPSGSTKNPMALLNESTSTTAIRLKPDSLDFPVVRTHPVSPTGLDKKSQNQTANLTIILLSTIFSFLILVQSSIIVCLLIKTKRKVKTEVYLRGMVVPSLIYGTKEQVTDLDEESCSHLSINHVYEVIPD